MVRPILSMSQHSIAPKRDLQKHTAVLCAITMLMAALVAGSAYAQTADENASHAPSSRVRMYKFELQHGVAKIPDGAVPASAPAGAHLTYYGGRVVSNMQVVQVLWGTGGAGSGNGQFFTGVKDTTSPSMATFYQGVLNSAYVDWLTEYNTPAQGGTNQQIGRGSFAAQYAITPTDTANPIDDSAIQTELASQIAAGHLPAPTMDAAGNNNTYYAIFFPHGQIITQGGSSSCQAGGFCAYHGTIASVDGHEVYYGVHPDMQAGSGCDTGCGGGTTFGNYCSVASHEMTETITDAEVGLATTNGPPLAWYDSTNGEIGDICNAQQGTIVGSDGVTYTVQQEFSNVADDCIVSRTVTNDFSISADPSSVSVTAGNSTSSTILTAITSGSAETISLGVSGAPSGVTTTLNPTSVTSGQSSTLSIDTTTSAAAGTYTLTVTGTAASGAHSTTVSLTITTEDFSISASPSALNLQQGTVGTSTISTAVVAGTAGTVNLTVSGVPSGATAAVNPTSITAGSSSTLTVKAGTAATGTYSILVTGTEGSNTHSATVSLTVTAGSGGGGIVNGGFETGNLTGWTASGASETVISSGCHSGTFCAQLGSSNPTSGSSTITQTFTAPAGAIGISLWYKMSCPDTVSNDWAVVRLKDNTAHTTALLLPKTCTTNSWTNIAGSLTAGHSYTLILTSHDNNAAGDPTYTVFDDVTIMNSTPPPVGIVNGGFETGDLAGWNVSGASETVINSGCHGGTYCAQLGSTSPTNGDSTVRQTFTAPAGATGISLWYKMSCPDTVSNDWAVVRLRDNTARTTAILLRRTCTTNSWTNIAGSITAGHSYTLMLTSHDNNGAGDPTYTVFDDVAIIVPGIVNGGFETGDLTGWVASGASESVISSGCHGGTYCALLGSSSPTNGDSTIAQTFTAPAGTTTISLWYLISCPDTVTYDWAVVTLNDNTAGTTATLLPMTCSNSGSWTNLTGSVTAGDSYLLTLTNHDDNYPGDPTYTLFDDVTVN